MTLSENFKQAIRQPSQHQQVAHAEGNNIMTWIGFKHIMYLAEEALLAHLRQAGVGMRTLFEQHGLLVEIVANEGRILHALKLDEDITTTIKPVASEFGQGQRFEVAMFVERGGKTVKTYSGAIRIVFKRDRSLGFPATEESCNEMAALIVEKAIDPCAGTSRGSRPLSESASEASQRLSWDFQVPYFYCHGNERLKMSGYLRLMEEADARFCAQQGIDVCDLLRERRWIPAVPAASVSIVEEAFMNEHLRVTYQVVDVIKTLLYKSTMLVYARRGAEEVLVARGEIVHAYAEIHDRTDWSMVGFDQRVQQAIGVAA